MTNSAPSSTSVKQLWAGRVLAALPSLLLLMSASMKLSHKEPGLSNFTGHLGYPESTLTPIGVTEIICTVLFLIPQTSLVGAILLVGYLGGAVATHVRAGEPFIIPVVVGVLVWASLYLRDARVRALVHSSAKRT